MEKLNSTYGYLNITKINKLPDTVRLEVTVGATQVLNGDSYNSNFKEKFKTNQLTVRKDNIDDIDAIIEFLRDNAIACYIKDIKNLCENNLIINYDDLVFNINDTQNYDLFLHELNF